MEKVAVLNFPISNDLPLFRLRNKLTGEKSAPPIRDAPWSHHSRSHVNEVGFAVDNDCYRRPGMSGPECPLQADGRGVRSGRFA